VSVSMTGDGSVVVSVRAAGSAMHGSGDVAGQWRAAAAGEAIFQQPFSGIVNGRQMAGGSSTYRFSVASNRLTLTWVAGRPDEAISAGPLHFRMEEGDSWITGSHSAFQLTRRR
jgi:hypothetical protein